MFHPLEKLHLLHDGYQKSFRVGRLDLLLIQSEGRTFLIENRCPHMDAPLTRASVIQGVIRCPLHGLQFNLRTGQTEGSVCSTPLKIHVPVYEGNMIGIVV